MKIVPLTLRQANDFVERHHRHSARTSNDGGKFAIGLEHDGRLVGVGIVGRPNARLIQMMEGPTTAEILRVAVSSDAPRNANSKISGRLKRIWQLMGGTRVVSYNLASESGDSMRAVGFEREADVPARAWDTPSRRRSARSIENEDKVRWGVQLPEVPA